MTWHCDYIDHGVTIFPDGRIRPCCLTAAEYSKPLSEINNSNRFSDLKLTDRPEACRKCWENEDRGLISYRKQFKTTTDAPGLKYLDFRHSNQCNLKCRYCNPHFSNQWAKELGNYPIIKKTTLDTEKIITHSLEEMYWCGGEPLMMSDHYEILKQVIDKGLSKNVTLRYNSNLTLLNYKDVNVIDLWEKFKQVRIAISIDSVGESLNYIRSGCDWLTVKNNIDKLVQYRQHHSNIFINLAPTLSILNIWFLPELFNYANSNNIDVHVNTLTGPDYLSLNAVPIQLQPIAKEKINQIKNYISNAQYDQIMHMLSQVDTEYLFLHAVRHILLLDKIRNEKLFDLLPFKDLAIDLTLKNYEYE